MAASNTENKRATDDDSSLSASTRQKSSPASSSGGNSQWKYEVFLSFRGEDTRNNFTDHLYAALNQKGICTFRDDEELERGKKIAPELLEAIERSMVSIVILSKNYASSKWCLIELAKIVECMGAKSQTVWPVFYKVDPSDVRPQRGDFKTAFDRHEQDFRDNLEQVKRWRSALATVGGLVGWHLRDESEVELITEIVDEIWKRLNQTQYFPTFDGGLVGIDSRVEEIYELLRLDISGEIRFVGIWGMGGIGKTTIARAVYERLSSDYEGSCFLANVREVSAKKGLERLQKMLLCEVLKEKDLNICDYHQGICLIRKRLCWKKIFLVLDDVDHIKQLERLVGRKDWFGRGSRIIVTTRDEHVLKSHEINNIYKVKGLDYNESHRLFRLKAFKPIEMTEDHVELSKRVVSYANGLPLALEVLGSFLRDRNIIEWKSAVEKLEIDPEPEIVKILRISYDGLRKLEREIFLDIACFFKGGHISRIKEILNSCDFHPDIGIKVLVERSLITIEFNTVQMHDVVQGMGWEIVREQHPKDPSKWSRLWRSQDVHRMLARSMEAPAVEAMIIVDYKKDITHANGRCFSTMSNLRILNISNVNISGDLEYLSNELRILKWWGYPLNTLPSNFNPQKLFQLSLCYSCIEYLWDGVKPFRELKTINLSYSQNLVRTPDFTNIPNLERLELQYCIRLFEVHQSVGSLGRLAVLNLNNCENVVLFPSDVYGLKALRILNLHGCSKLDRLPLNLEAMEHLEELDVAGTAIRQLPSLPLLANLRTLSFRGCKGGPPKTWETWSSYLFSLLLPARRPSYMGLLLHSLAGFPCLQILDLSDCNLVEGAIPEDVGSLYSLRELNISGNDFISLPDTISQLSKLKIFCLEKCHRLQSLPKLPPGLVFVGAEECTSLKTVSIVELTSPAIALHFFNCFNLVETQGRNNNNLAIMLLKRWLQHLLSQIDDTTHHDSVPEEIFYTPQFHIRLLGSEIPNLFDCQSEGSTIFRRLPNGWFNEEFVGFVVCAVFSPPDHSDDVYIKCVLQSSSGREVGFNYPGFLTTGSDHLWLAYLWWQKSYRGDPCVNGVGAHFFISRLTGSAARMRPFDTEPLVKRCGIRPLYRQDVEHLEDLSAGYVAPSKFEDLSATDIAQNCRRASGSGIAMPRVLEESSIRKKYGMHSRYEYDEDALSSKVIKLLGG